MESLAQLSVLMITAVALLNLAAPYAQAQNLLTGSLSEDETTTEEVVEATWVSRAINLRCAYRRSS